MGGKGESLRDVPFEFVGKVAGAGTVTEAGDVEGGAAATRHIGVDQGCVSMQIRVTRRSLETGGGLRWVGVDGEEKSKRLTQT